MAPSTEGSGAAGPGAGCYQMVWPEACVGLSCGHMMWFVVLSGSCGLQEGECGVAAQRGGALGGGHTEVPTRHVWRGRLSLKPRGS